MHNGDLHLGRNVWNRNVYSISKFASKDAEEGLKVSGYIHIYKYNLGKSFVHIYIKCNRNSSILIFLGLAALCKRRFIKN
jgi:hypothetical protein